MGLSRLLRYSMMGRRLRIGSIYRVLPRSRRGFRSEQEEGGDGDARGVITLSLLSVLFLGCCMIRSIWHFRYLLRIEMKEK